MPIKAGRTNGSITRDLIVAGFSMFCLVAQVRSSASAPPKIELLTGERCLKELSAAAHPQLGKVRISLIDITDPLAKSRGLILVEQNKLDPTFLACSPTFGTSSLNTSSIRLMMDGGPFYSGRGFGIAPRGTKFSFSIAVARPNALQLMRNMQVNGGTWLSEGQQYGLEKFQQIAGGKNRKPTASTTYQIASNFYGKTTAGSTVDIRCSGDDPSKVLACEMAIDVASGRPSGSASAD